MPNNAATQDRPAAPVPLGRRHEPGRSPQRRGWHASRRFYICLGVLVVSGLTMQSVATWLGASFRKEPLPLKRALYRLDKERLAPQYGLDALQPGPLDDETEKNLGTKEYLRWRLVDRTRPRRDAAYRADLFITYHTGQPDMVPHDPHECVQAAGWSLKGERELELEATRPDGTSERIPVSMLEFEPPAGASRIIAGSDGPTLTILYFFYANGRYRTTRNGVRLAVNNLFDRFAYYSKVEVSFSDDAGRPAGPDASIDAGRILLQKLMPILWQDHYQDWERIRAGEAPESS